MREKERGKEEETEEKKQRRKRKRRKMKKKNYAHILGIYTFKILRRRSKQIENSSHFCLSVYLTNGTFFNLTNRFTIILLNALSLKSCQVVYCPTDTRLQSITYKKNNNQKAITCSLWYRKNH